MILRDVREPSELATVAIWDHKRSIEQTPVDTSQSSGLSMPLVLAPFRSFSDPRFQVVSGSIQTDCIGHWHDSRDLEIAADGITVPERDAIPLAA
jgi:hypothetical protein